MKEARSTAKAKLVVVIDDDPLVLEATGGLLKSWGCQVVTAECYADAMAQLSELRKRPDLIICDYRLSEGATGIDAIKGLRSAFEIPALLISGDPGSPVGNNINSYHLLHKPVDVSAFHTALVEASVLRR